MKRILAVGALALMTGSTALAQGGSGSDHSGVGGAGAGVGGSLGLGVPTSGTTGSGGGFGLTVNSVNGVATSFQAGGNVTTTIGTTTVTVPPAAAATVGGALAGNTAAVNSLTTGLTASVGAGPAANLSQALVTLGGAPSFANLVSAVNAYNAAVAALPAGATPPAQLLAARAALQRLSR